MGTARPVCEKCGAPSVVHVSNQIPGKGLVIRHFCLRCAQTHDGLDVSATTEGEHRLSDAAALITAGTFILVLSLLADWLQLGGTEGFGYQQIGGVIVGGVLLLLGAIVRAPILLVFGLIIGVMSLLADRFPVGAAEGFGSNQIVGTLLGLVSIAAGVLSARRKRSSSR